MESSTLKKTLTTLIFRLNSTSFILKSDESILVDIPLSIFVLACAFCFYFCVIALVVSIILGYKISIECNNPMVTQLNTSINLLKE